MTETPDEKSTSNLVPGTSRGRKKVLAGKAGVSTRTLRRMEKGEAVSEEIRRRGEAVVGRMDPEVDPLRDAHVAALIRMADPSTSEDWNLEMVWFKLGFVAICLASFVEPWWFYYGGREGWDLLISDTALVVHGAFVLLLVTIPFCMWRLSRSNSSWTRISTERRSYIPIVVEGIRHGSIKCLGEAEARFLKSNLGERRFRDVLDAAPRKVQLL